ncbi:MAG: hypothetical protein KAQ62_26845, partial [Cyclobacteriaceae bacterium]|nr:hypothetical protein [Cyclobacteriaceae bacterium]
MKKGILFIFFLNVFIISSRSQTLETCETPGIKNEDNSYTFTALQNHTEKKLVNKLPGPIYTNLRYAEEVTVSTYIQYSYSSLNDSVRSNKREEFFDANGNNIQSILYNWWVIDNDWRPRYRTLSSFSDSGQLLIQLRDEWDNDAKVWKSHYKTSQENYSDTLSVHSCSVWQE